MSNLRALTRRYWILSQSFQGRGESVTVEEAFEGINELTENLGPHRKVVTKVLSLQAAIIKGGRRPKKNKKFKASISTLPIARNQ